VEVVSRVEAEFSRLGIPLKKLSGPGA